MRRRRRRRGRLRAGGDGLPRLGTAAQGLDKSGRGNSRHRGLSVFDFEGSFLDFVQRTNGRAGKRSWKAVIGQCAFAKKPQDHWTAKQEIP